MIEITITNQMTISNQFFIFNSRFERIILSFIWTRTDNYNSLRVPVHRTSFPLTDYPKTNARRHKFTFSPRYVTIQYFNRATLQKLPRINLQVGFKLIHIYITNTYHINIPNTLLSVSTNFYIYKSKREKNSLLLSIY